MSEVIPVPDDRRARRPVRQTVKILFGVLAVGLLVAAVYSQRNEFMEAVSRLAWTTVVLSFVLGLVALFANMMSWRGAMAGVGAPLPMAAAARVFLISQLGKYVPGSVWPVLVQVELTKERGISRVRSTTGALVGMAVGVVTSASVASVLLVTSAQDALDDYWFVLLVVPLGVTALTPPVLRRLLTVAAKATRKEIVPPDLTWRGLLTSSAWSALMWVAFGFHAWVVVRDLLPDGAPGIALTIGAFALAWLVGFLMILAPAGVGVRELALVVALGGALSVPDALALALVSRVLLTVGDAIAGGGALFLARPHRKLHAEIAHE
ncbi:lysylphosphatidylglycerol synthase transmembrane domain-containing protein [Sanguibacter suaedae]|uniref:Flippase-like domain-containing protein n=1 Tax=Sanguibacter suaedae TaxID=2795737 RepID=A0A934ID73_9MICO|nr:lysylphosphatidylglycerol synthase domain-containing protein [Sanguibacter suaedae]MBI9114774.1 flippase-like domain-containing protein [Sanguibacter suaedae]